PKRGFRKLGDGSQRSTAALRPLPGEKRGRRDALICIGPPVRGSRPSRAGRSTTLKFPNPTILTSSPLVSVAVMASNVASTADAASAFVRWVLSATAAISSFFVIGMLPFPESSVARKQSAGEIFLNPVELQVRFSRQR